MEVAYSLYGPISELLDHECLIYSKPQLNAQPSAPILQFEIPKSEVRKPRLPEMEKSGL